jgi:predicted nucleic acid-binding protein
VPANRASSGIVFCDTSVLLAAIHEPHEHHTRSLAVIRPLTRGSAACALHSLAELYATLSRLPGAAPQPRPSDVRAAVLDILQVFTPIGLATTDYRVVLNHLAELGIAGGHVYDALILRCAAKAGAAVIYTWNTKHFRTLAPRDLLPLIHEPPR